VITNMANHLKAQPDVMWLEHVSHGLPDPRRVAAPITKAVGVVSDLLNPL
jgi:hypothetical protein